MSIVIFGDSFSFPDGDAATNRVHTYAKGFYENGQSVNVICFTNDYESVLDGEINGINFYHPFEQRTRNKYFIIRRWQKFIKYFKAISLIRRINKKDKIIVINCWTQSILTLLFAFITAKFHNTSLILERNEHPLRNYQGSFLNRLQGNIKLYLEMSFCSGYLCISHHLIDFYKSKGFNPGRMFLVPSTVDPSRFIQTGEQKFQFPYIGYFGGLTFSRDTIDILIKAFAKISGNYPGIHLVLGGFCTDEEKKQLKDLIVQLGIREKVELLKYMKREEIINYISQAYILVMVRKNDLKALASFPSKLTEFLVTAKPVISVNVGEISDYLTDGENAFLVEPENLEALTDKLIFVLENYNLAQEVGLKGKELTNTIFNYRYQAGKILQFINTL
jgi:glycosyltransferase involved in cell wall biosynthesis